MPWQTPTLRDVRGIVRDNIRATLPGADASIPNSVLRVLSDNQGALCHLTLQYIDWLALQLLPDTAETEWLDRHGHIWLVNADGTTGRKLATLARGTVTFTGEFGASVPPGTQLDGGSSSGGISYETTAGIVIGTTETPAPVRALDPGAAGNLPTGSPLGIASSVPPGIDSTARVVELDGGADTESDEYLRARVLSRIRQPPMGGAVHDYVNWALGVPGVTRAWAAPEQGIGTITVRFMMDELRADNDGFPLSDDEEAVALYIDQKRPVTVKDCYVLAPIKYFVDITIRDLLPDDDAARAAIEKNIKDMLYEQAAPGTAIYAAWISFAIMEAAGVQSFTLLTTTDHVMPSLGHMAVLGTILYE